MSRPLREILLRRLGAQGPISVAEYMAECLLHPSVGYYSSKSPFGTEGDFITAPEISQMFGELIGLCLAQCWIDQGRPAPFTLAELGPGRGTLMSDMLRATSPIPEFTKNAQIHLVEASEKLRAVQKDALSAYDVSFVNETSELPDQPLFLVANEFFDALPIRQFMRTETGWRERQIGIDNEDLAFGLGPEMPQPALANRLEDTEPGDLVEYASSLATYVAPVGHRISSYGGMALVIDYGDWRSLGDTLQALYRHEPVNPLKNPGACDLTAHVDFEALAVASGCAFSRLTPQGVFLDRLGITLRAQQLAQRLSGRALDNHVKAHRRLTHPDEMGNLFKVMALHASGNAPPPGLTS